ncbi:MAG: hypothetical protein JEY91_02045 [Spirochaetaceae bacterium]|nr:hypothetical protein [Spirochaetaceae bacterium]
MKQIVLLFLIQFTVIYLSANEFINSDYDNYYNYLELIEEVESSYLSFRAYSNNDWIQIKEGIDNPWSKRTAKNRRILSKTNWNLQLLDSELFLSYNSTYADGYNDGAMWQGRGFNTRISGGVSFQSEYFSASFAPEFWIAENKNFNIVPSSISNPNGYYFSGIDYPQIFGNSLYYDFSFGQSDIRFNYKAFTVGLSTENFTIGPSEYNQLLMSCNASGFPHLDIGFNTINTKTGLWELRFFWGILNESDFFDEINSNDQTFITGFSFSYSFPFLKNLTLGGNRVIQTPFELVDGWSLLTVIDFTDKGFGTYFGFGTSYGYDNLDQKLSLTADWKFPVVGFNIYFEYFREDYTKIRNLALIPEHTMGYVIGAKKSIPISTKRGFLITAEMVGMQQSRDYELYLGIGGTYYTHHINTHGYTHKGQILGTPVGPGGDGQFLTIDYYDSWGRVGLFGTRIRNNMDYVYKTAYYDSGFNPRTDSYRDIIDVEIKAGFDCVVFVGPVDLFGTIAVAGRLNTNYIPSNDILNFYGNLGVRYRH